VAAKRQHVGNSSLDKNELWHSCLLILKEKLAFWRGVYHSTWCKFVSQLIGLTVENKEFNFGIRDAYCKGVQEPSLKKRGPFFPLRRDALLKRVGFSAERTCSLFHVLAGLTNVRGAATGRGAFDVKVEISSPWPPTLGGERRFFRGP
jgi:hypothetical protein